MIIATDIDVWGNKFKIGNIIYRYRVSARDAWEVAKLFSLKYRVTEIYGVFQVKKTGACTSGGAPVRRYCSAPEDFEAPLY